MESESRNNHNDNDNNNNKNIDRDLHIWKITSDFDALTAHIVVYDISKSQAILWEIQSLLEKKFNIVHTKIQIETYK